MQPSSLVFVAIVAGWAAYLLPRWVVRRDALGQSRGPDRDSAQMRVLARRESRPPTTVRPSTAPLLTAPATQRATGAVITTRRGPGLVRPPADAAAARRSAAARRARVLFSLGVFLVASWGVVALPGVPWWAAVPASALLVLDLVALVVAARGRTAARRAAARRAAMRIAVSQRQVLRATTSSPTRREPTPVARAAAPAEPIDVRGAAPRAQDAEAVGDTWTPVPVPRPTYMLKPVVPRPEPRPLEEPAAPAAAAVVAPGAAGGVGPGSAGAMQPEAAPTPPPTSASASASGPGPGPTPTPASTPALAEPEHATPRPWEVDHTWADDLDVVLARRRAVNG